MANKIKRIKPKGTQKPRAGEARKAASIEQKAKKASHFFYRCEFQKAIPLLEELSGSGWTTADSLLYWTYTNQGEKTVARSWASKGMDDKDVVSTLLWALGADEKEKAAFYEEWSEKAWEQAKQGDFLAMCALAPWAIERADEKSEAELMSMLQKPGVQRCYLVFQTLGNLYSAPGFNVNLPKAVDFYTKALNMGDNVAAEHLALLYLDPDSEVYNQARGVEYMRQAAEAGNVQAMVRLADMYVDGDVVPKDTQKALTYYRKAAADMPIDAPEIEWFHVGSMCDRMEDEEWRQLALDSFRERSSTNDIRLLETVILTMLDALRVVPEMKDWAKRLLHYLDRALKLGSKMAPVTLGHIMESGYLNVTKDPQKAKEYFEEGVRRDAIEAYYALGRLYEQGKGVEQDISKARELYEKGEQRGSELALRSLVKLYASGGVPGEDTAQSSHVKMLYYCNKAASMGSTEAFYDLGKYFLYEAPDDKKDIDKGLHYLEKAADSENTQALTELGRLYFDGEFVERDEDKAFAYLMESASHDDPKGQFYLGLCYLEGCGIEPDGDVGLDYIIESACNEYAPAWIELGDIAHETASGNPKRLQLAIDNYRQATELGDVVGFLRLSRVYLEDGDHYDPDEAIKWLEAGADQGDGICCAELGNIYLDGHHVSPDYPKAVYWYRQGEQLDNEFCLLQLARVYAEGKGVPIDDTKGIEYLHRAATHGSYGAAKILELAQDYEAKGESKSLKDLFEEHTQNQLDTLQEYVSPSADHLLTDSLRGNMAGQDDDDESGPDEATSNRDLDDDIERWKMICERYGTDDDGAYLWAKLAELYRKSDREDAWDKALECYERAAECGFPEAWETVADAYYYGSGPQEDQEKAVGYYMKAIDAGDESAWNSLGMAYISGINDRVNAKAARDCFRKATAVGDGLGWVNLGNMYSEGIGGEQSDKKAFGCFLRGAQDGLPLAWKMVATCYAEGLGVPQNTEKALQCLKKAERLVDAELAALQADLDEDY